MVLGSGPEPHLVPAELAHLSQCDMCTHAVVTRDTLISYEEVVTPENITPRFLTEEVVLRSAPPALLTPKQGSATVVFSNSGP